MIRSLFDVQWGLSIEKQGETRALFEQVHGNNILSYRTTEDYPGKSAPLIQADGVQSYLPQSEVYVHTADCYPVLFFTEDPEGPIAALHAGWRGLKKRIVKKGLSFFTDFAEVHAVLGPAIGPCCFSVREDFVEDWKAEGLNPHNFLSQRDHRIYFNLLDFLLTNELDSVPKKNIHLDLFRCTVCSSPPLPSFRRNKSANPRLRTWIRKLK